MYMEDVLMSQKGETIEESCECKEYEQWSGVYEIAHAAIGRCGNPHEGWLKNAGKKEKWLEEIGMISPRMIDRREMHEKEFEELRNSPCQKN